MYEFECVNKQDYYMGFKQEYVEMIVYSALSFFLPFLIGHPQIVVGIGVNAALILSALNVRGYKILPVIIFPSLGVLTKGLIFGPFTWFLVYMIPFIWVGNAVLVYAFKRLYLHKEMNRWITLVIGSVAKMVFLFVTAFILVKLSVLPALFLTTMGVFQLYTALAGGTVAFGLHLVKKKVIS